MNIYNFCRTVYAAMDDKDEATNVVAGLLRGNPAILSERMRLRFRAVLLRWVILTEQWPFRMAMMVQLMLDDAQLHGGVEALYDADKYEGIDPPEHGLLRSKWMHKAQLRKDRVGCNGTTFCKCSTDDEFLGVCYRKTNEVNTLEEHPHLCHTAFTKEKEKGVNSKSKYKVIYGPADNDIIDYDQQSSPKGDFKTVPLHKFFEGAVQHYVYDFGRATRDVSRNEQKDGAASEFDEIKELMSLDSDPEVFDALLSVGMPKPEKECPGADAASMSSSNTADDSHEAMTLAECYAMAVHFSFNLNPAITAAVQRIMSGRSNYDQKISGYRNKTLEECVDLYFGEARADGLNRHPGMRDPPKKNKQ
jgi:hypothetical protein